MQVRAVTFSFLCQLLEKYGTFIARCNALIAEVSSCIGCSQAALDDADDSADPRAALVELVFAAETVAANARRNAAQTLRGSATDRDSLYDYSYHSGVPCSTAVPVSPEQKQARDGVGSVVNEARRSVLNLALAAEEAKLAKLRDELMSTRLSVLKKRARGDGVPEEVLVE
eukprot:SAG31_NODE_5765_length_2336_cov_21.434063_1_plen_170_part_10